MEGRSLLALLQLASPALPVGAYSYSEGLEYLIGRGAIASAEELYTWLAGELDAGAIGMEAAILVRQERALAAGENDTVLYWDRWLTASREAEELRLQSEQMGRSLARLLLDIDPDPRFTAMLDRPGLNFATAYAIAAYQWQIGLDEAIAAYLHAWAANLVNAGVKLVPLGQTAGQRLLLRLQPDILTARDRALAATDDDLECCSLGLTLASMGHEAQYARLFRS